MSIKAKIIGMWLTMFIISSCQKYAKEPLFIDVFIPGKETDTGQNTLSYTQFRQQNVIVTSSGKIVIIVQGRETSAWSDRSGQDLLCKISTDNGLTWSKPREITNMVKTG